MARLSCKAHSKQAGFFEAAADRLVRPNIRETAPKPPGAAESSNNSSSGNGAGGNGGGGGDHPLIQGLLLTLPKPGEEWAFQDRFNWLNMANSIFKMVYKASDAKSDVEVKLIDKP